MDISGRKKQIEGQHTETLPYRNGKNLIKKERNNMQLKTVMTIMVVSLAVLIFQPAIAAEAPKPPTLGQINQAIGENAIIKAEYQRRVDECTVRGSKLLELQAAYSKAAPKGKKESKAPVKPAVKTSAGVSK